MRELDAFDGVAWLEPPILTSRGIAGRSYEVTIGGRGATVTLPSAGPSELTLPGRGPEVQEIPRFPRPPLPEDVTGGVRITVTNRIGGHPEGLLIVEAVRLRWRDRAHREAIANGKHFPPESLLDDLGGWVALVRDWLAAWSGNVRQTIELEPEPVVRYACLSSSVGPIGGGGSSPVHVLGQRSSSAQELRAAFAAASAGWRIPPERELLAEAIVQGHQGEHRHAVITACTAAEVALSRSARELLTEAGRSDADCDDLLGGVHGVADVYRLNAERKGGLPVSLGRVINQLARPRNLAAHAGDDPDDETVKRAIRTARELVDLRPLLTPAQVLAARRSE